VIGLFVVLGWAFVGLIVAVVEKRMSRSRDADQTMVTVLCIVGAVAGGFVGQVTRLYVFGEPLGFVFSAGGAELLLWFDRTRTTSRRPSDKIARPAVVATATSHPGISFLQAFGWGALCGPALAMSGLFGLILASNLYPQRYTQIPAQFLLFPLGGLIVGFGLAATARLARPHWTAAQMLTLVAMLTIGYAAFLVNWGRNNARPAHVTVAFEPDPVTATPCDSASCPPAQPPLQWTVQGSLRVEETAGLGGTVDAIAVTSYTRGRFGRGTISGPHVHYTAGQLSGAHHVRSNEPASYPLRYSYRTEHGDSRRIVSVVVQFTDAAGHQTTGSGGWTVR
jgi:uncharacterized membrane protein YeaQ/YmgE (transglycosylase-associated protein family)